MTERRKVLPARKLRDRSGDDESLLLRSAESLGRVIGTLQRQLDDATRRLSGTAGAALDQMPSVREIADRLGLTQRIVRELEEQGLRQLAEERSLSAWN